VSLLGKIRQMLSVHFEVYGPATNSSYLTANEFNQFGFWISTKLITYLSILVSAERFWFCERELGIGITRRFVRKRLNACAALIVSDYNSGD